MVDLSIVMIVYHRVRLITVWCFSYLSGWWFQPHWKIWKSVGMITPNIWKKMFQTTNHITVWWFSYLWFRNFPLAGFPSTKPREPAVGPRHPPPSHGNSRPSAPKFASLDPPGDDWRPKRNIRGRVDADVQRWQESFEQTLKLPFKHCLSVPVFKSCLHDINSGQNRLKTNLKHRKNAGRNMESLDLAPSHNSVCQRELVSRFTLPDDKMRFLQLFPWKTWRNPRHESWEPTPNNSQNTSFIWSKKKE